MNPLLLDLALILIVAGLTTVVFKYLKQPLVLGYIVAGFLTGPYFEYIPTVKEVSSLDFWGEIGVVFLLFGLGLEFNIKKLIKVGSIGFTTVTAEVILMSIVGFSVGRLLGWSDISSIFLGGMLTISSTSIIIKAFDDLGLKSKKFAQNVFGVLVVEDIVAVLLLVVLSALAISSDISGTEMFYKILYLFLFLLLWFTGGIYIIPSIFRKIKFRVSDETLTVISLGLCLGMVAITEYSGFSSALGAFMMGSILSGTIYTDRIIKLVQPVKDFFGAIFFVTVGMLVNPQTIAEHWSTILLISAVVIFIKPLSAILGLLLSGQTIRNAMQSGFCLCQIGEFSFIIASMGQSVGVVNDELYPIIVSVSIITTFATPYMINASGSVYDKLYSLLPVSWARVFDRLGTGRKTINRRTEWNSLIKRYFTVVIVYSGWLVLVVTFFTKYVNPFIISKLTNFTHVKLLCLVITLLAMSPFVYGLLKKRDRNRDFDKIWKDSRFSRGPLISMVLLKYIVAAIAVNFVIAKYLAASAGVVILLTLIVVAVVYYSKNLKNYYSVLEQGFLENYHYGDVKRKVVIPRALADEMHTDTVLVGVSSPVAGRSIRTIHRMYNTGALVLRIIRGESYIDVPAKEEILLPGDMAVVLGEDEQIMKFRSLCESPSSRFNVEPDEIDLFHFTIPPESPIIGMDANITRFRDRFGLILVAIDRDGVDGLLKPNSTVIFEPSDTIWIAGDRKHVESLMN